MLVGFVRHDGILIHLALRLSVAQRWDEDGIVKILMHAASLERQSEIVSAEMFAGRPDQSPM